MRVSTVAFCLLLVAAGAAADEEKSPTKPGAPMTEPEREAAVKRIAELDARSRTLYVRSQFDKALAVAREALALRQKALAPDHPDMAVGLDQVATIRYVRKEFADARRLFERSLEVREKAFGADDLRVTDSLNGLAVVLVEMGAYREALPLGKRALSIRLKALGPDDARTGQSYNNLAQVLQKLGEYPQARDHYARALKIYEKTLGPNHRRVGLCVTNIAILTRNLGAFDQARPLFEKAIAIFEKAVGPEHPDVAWALENLGWLLRTIGAYKQARPLYERALKIREKKLGPNHPDVASSLSTLAELLGLSGSYAEARPLSERALRIRESVLGVDHPDVGASLDVLAAQAYMQGSYEEARQLWDRTLAICEKAFGPEHMRVAQCLNNVGISLHAGGELEKARTLFERALKIYEKRLGPRHPATAQSLDNLAHLLRDLGDHEAALPLHERSLSIHEETYGSDHPAYAKTLNRLGEIHRLRGDLDKALSLIERAIAIDEDTFGPDYPGLAHDLNNLALLHLARGERERVAPVHARCLDIVERSVRHHLTGLQATERLALVRSVRYYLDVAIWLAGRLERPVYADVIRFKGLMARAAAAERRLGRTRDAQTRTRVEALRAAERKLASLANSIPGAFPRAGRAERKRLWQETYAKAAADREALASTLAREFAPLRDGLARLDLSVSDIQSRLGEDGVLLDFLRSADRYYVWLVRSDGHAHRVDLGESGAIESAAKAFAEHAADTGASWKPAGKALRDLVFTPVERRLGPKVKTLYVCPDGALAAIPFGALPGRDEGRLIVDEFVLNFVSMAQDVVPGETARDTSAGTLLLGGVQYGARPTGSRRGPPRRRFTRLPGTEDEVRSIESRLGKPAVVLLGDQASEARLRAGAANRRVVHLATHGFVRTDLMRGFRDRSGPIWRGAGTERQLTRGHDPMLLAGLALAGANSGRGGGDDDGILSALEASHLDLDGTELVVLSACETARGTIESGEGVIGLVQGFQMAGARRVIGSLWKVDDEATRALMIKFYELWNPKDGKKGLDAAAALKKAQEHVRSQEKWKHPYYWAAWVLWGL